MALIVTDEVRLYHNNVVHELNIDVDKYHSFYADDNIFVALAKKGNYILIINILTKNIKYSILDDDFIRIVDTSKGLHTLTPGKLQNIYSGKIYHNQYTDDTLYASAKYFVNIDEIKIYNQPKLYIDYEIIHVSDIIVYKVQDKLYMHKFKNNAMTKTKYLPSENHDNFITTEKFSLILKPSGRYTLVYLKVTSVEYTPYAFIIQADKKYIIPATSFIARPSEYL